MILVDKLNHSVEVQHLAVSAVGARSILRAVLRWQELYIVVRHVEVADPETHSKQDSGGSSIQCNVLEMPGALLALASEFPRSFRDSVGRLERRLHNGCVLFVLRVGNTPNEPKRIAGYSICQPDVFSAFGSIQKISSDILFSHYFEFLPEYRGRGLKTVLEEKRTEYCRMHRLRAICGVIACHNIASLTTSLRAGFKVVGTMRQVSILRGLFVWQTSWEAVEKALDGNV